MLRFMRASSISLGVTWALVSAGSAETVDLAVSPRTRILNSVTSGVIDEVPQRGTFNPYRPLKLNVLAQGPYRIEVAPEQQRVRYRSRSATAQLQELDQHIAQSVERVFSLTNANYREISNRPLQDHLTLNPGPSQRLKSPSSEARPIHLQKIYRSLNQYVEALVHQNESITKSALLDSITEHFHFHAKSVQPLTDLVLQEITRRSNGLEYQKFGIINPAAPWQLIAPNDLLLVRSISSLLPYHVAAEQIGASCRTMLTYWSLVEKTKLLDVHDKLFIDTYLGINTAHNDYEKYVGQLIIEIEANCEENERMINQGERSLDMERMVLSYLFNVNDNASLQANTNIMPWGNFRPLFKLYLGERGKTLNATNLYVQYLKIISVKKKDCEKVQDALTKLGKTPKKPCASWFWTQADFIAAFPRVADIGSEILQYADLIDLGQIYASSSELVQRAAIISDEINASDNAYGAAGTVYGAIILETRRRSLGSDLALLKTVNFTNANVSPTHAFKQAFDLVTYWTLKPGTSELLEAFKVPMNSANKLDDFLRDLLRTENLGAGLRNAFPAQGARSFYRDSLVRKVRDLVDAAQEIRKLRPLIETREKLIADLGMPHVLDMAAGGGLATDVGQIFLPPDSRVARTLVRKGDYVEGNQPLLVVELDFERRGQVLVDPTVLNAHQIAEGAIIEFGAGTSDFRIGGKIDVITNLGNGKYRVDLIAFPFVPRAGAQVANEADIIRLNGHTCTLPAYAGMSICNSDKPWFPRFGTVKAEILGVW